MDHIGEVSFQHLAEVAIIPLYPVLLGHLLELGMVPVAEAHKLHAAVVEHFKRCGTQRWRLSYNTFLYYCDYFLYPSLPRVLLCHFQSSSAQSFIPLYQRLTHLPFELCGVPGDAH